MIGLTSLQEISVNSLSQKSEERLHEDQAANCKPGMEVFPESNPQGQLHLVKLLGQVEFGDLTNHQLVLKGVIRLNHQPQFHCSPTY